MGLGHAAAPAKSAPNARAARLAAALAPQLKPTRGRRAACAATAAGSHRAAPGPLQSARAGGAVAAIAPRAPRRRALLDVRALAARGRAFDAGQLQVKKPLGEGSYGQVFEGTLDTGDETERVVLKRVKARVQGAEEMAQMEHLMNVTASKSARGSIAEFLGFCEVERDQAVGNLTPGLWLVWRYEGSNTLAFYLRRRDGLRALARDLGVPEELVVPMAMRQLLTGLAALHAAGLVHRDIKPLNIIFSERDQRLKLIDLGACADLRSGTNFSPDESILDPLYCPPEQYIMPTDSPHIAKNIVAQALSPMLWAQHKPDRFDTWSAGIVLMSLVLPTLRTPRGLGLFLKEFEKTKYDLDAWRASCRWAGPRDFALLDADGGAGWAVAQALLRPRSVEVSADGGVAFVGGGGAPMRMSAAEALRHRFFRAANQIEKERGLSASSLSSPDQSEDEGAATPRGSATAGRRPASAPPPRWTAGGAASGSAAASTAPAAAPAPRRGGGGLFGAAAGMLRGLTDSLFDLEAQIMQAAGDTASQTTTVRKLEAKVAKGQADARQLAAEKQKLGRMRRQLDDLEEEAVVTQKTASGLFGFLGLGGGGGGGGSGGGRERAERERREKAAAAEAAAAADAAADAGKKSGASQLWESLAAQLTWLESRVKAQQSATEKKKAWVSDLREKAWVSDLREKVAQGAASPDELREAEAELGEAAQQLESLQSSYSTLWGQASGMLKNLATGTGTGRPASTPGGGTVERGGTRSAAAAVRAGLSIGGLAVRITSDIFSSVTGDAQRILKDMEAEANVRRARKEADAGFLEMLETAQPPLAFGAAWGGAEARFGGDARWAGVGDGARRRELFDAYVAALAQVEAQRMARGQAAMEALLRRLRPEPDTAWEEVDALLEVEPLCAALTRAERREAFDEHMRRTKLERALAAVSERTENAFRALLAEADPPITAGATWPAVKPLIWQDPRYSVLEEPRRAELFAEFAAALRARAAQAARERAEAAAVAAEAVAAARAAAAAGAASAAAAAAAAAAAERGSRAASPEFGARPASPSGPESIVLTAGELGLTDEAFDALNTEDLAQLRLLRWEQEKLRRQYEEMESRLRDMEGRLGSTPRGASPVSPPPAPGLSPKSAPPPELVPARGAPPASPAMEVRDDGVVYRFDGDEAGGVGDAYDRRSYDLEGAYGGGGGAAAAGAPAANGKGAASSSAEPAAAAPGGYYQETPLQDLICSMRNWDIFLAAVQRDTTLHQDLLSFVAQPWVDRTWYRLNTHPAMAAVFSDRQYKDVLSDLEGIVAAIDRSLTPEQAGCVRCTPPRRAAPRHSPPRARPHARAHTYTHTRANTHTHTHTQHDQAKWFIPYLRDVSTAPVIYTSMTNLTSRVFDDDAVASLERLVDAAVTPGRVAKALKAIKAAMAAPVPPAVRDATPEGGNPVVAGAFTGFEAYWTKERRAKYLDVYDEIQTDEHYARVAAFMRGLAPLLETPALGQLLSGLDAALPQARLDRLATRLGALLGGTWGAGVAARLDDALPKARVITLLRALDEALDEERIARLPAVLGALSSALTPQRAERAFEVGARGRAPARAHACACVRPAPAWMRARTRFESADIRTLHMSSENSKQSSQHTDTYYAQPMHLIHVQPYQQYNPQALEQVLEDRRLSGYRGLIDAATSDPARLERLTSALERLLDARAAGSLLDAAAAVLGSPARLDAALSALGAAWGDDGKLARWLDAVDAVNAGGDGRGSKLLAAADLAATPVAGSTAGVGLPNLWAAVGDATSPAAAEALGAALNRATPMDTKRFAAVLTAAPALIRAANALLPTGAALRLLRALDAVFGEDWARAELGGMAAAALGGGGSRPVLAGAGRIMWAAHGAMLQELLGGGPQ
ncbi:MAG: hypothetical protein J3K34DRAFT_524625 [Monoraphidium minutum]|nr:MAG: hypothetical protein J3K34DRAFT_524625 [Monoraphidium minutum]